MLRFKAPKTWFITRLGDVAEVQTGLALNSNQQDRHSNNPVRLPYLRVANVQDGHLDLSEIKYIDIPKDKVSRYLLQKDDVLMTEGGDFDKLGRGTIWKDEIPNCIHQNHIFVVRTQQDKLLPYYLECISGSHIGRTYFLNCSKQTTNLASVNSTQLKHMPLALPPLPEQKKIAEILGTWDTAIEKAERLIEAKKNLKKALMQQLLTGKKRFKEFKGSKWGYRKADEIFKSHSQKNNGDEELLSVTQDRGTIPRNMLEGKVVMPEGSTNGYKLVVPGDFIISLRSFQVFAVSPKWDSGV
jgi:type I restriction enzyme, S subunit